MFKLNIIHIFIVLLLLKICSIYINNNYLLLLCVLTIITIYLYTNKTIIFDIPLFKNIDKNKLFEYKKKILLTYVNNFFNNFNPEVKSLLIDKINLFNENSSIVFYNKLKNCNLYMDVLHSQRTDIINTAMSLFITIPNYENYDFFNLFIKDIHDTLDDIFEFINPKCNYYHIKNFIYYDKNIYNDSFNHI